MEGFAQEDIPPGFETEPLESEKCLSAIENKRSYTSVDFAGPGLSLPMKAGNLMIGRREGELRCIGHSPPGERAIPRLRAKNFLRAKR